jgi:hypothetical protein
MSDDTFKKRAEIGEACIVAAFSGQTHDEDREMYARDAVSNILTALFGKAGARNDRGEIRYSSEARANAENFLSACLRSWRGDAEDYEAAGE